MRTFLSITVIAAVAVMALVPAANAAFWTPPKPKKSHYSFKWLSYGCKANAQGQNRAYATAQAWVLKLKSKHGMYRQKVKVQIDRMAGYGDSDPTWREVDGSSGTKGDAGWFVKYAEVPDMALPDGINLTHNTGMQPDDAILTAKATVWLKQYGWPKAVWRYRKRSAQFTCPGVGGMELPAAEQLPAAGGG